MLGEDWLASWAVFVGLMALGQFSPGPDMILLSRISLRDGRRAGLLVMLGIVSGLCLHAAFAIGGMSTLLERGGLWEKIMSVAAACYLSWLGWQMLRAFRERPSEKEDWSASDGRARAYYLKGLFCNLLNPKVLIFFAGLTTFFLKGERETLWPFLLWLTIVVEGMLLWGLWVLILQKRPVRQFYQKQGKWIDLAFGFGLLVLAACLLVGVV